MYSDNDYRYYLEHQLMESGDFLAHYGVKGMKWKDHKYVIDPRLRERMAKGLGIGKPRIGSNPMFQRKRGITSRINGARRRAQLGIGKQLMKSKTGRKVLRKAATRDLKNKVNSAKKSFSKAKKASGVGVYKYDDGEVRGRAVGIGGKKRTLVLNSAKNRYTGGKTMRFDLYDNKTGRNLKGGSLTKRTAFDSWQVGAKANRPGSGSKLANNARKKIKKGVRKLDRTLMKKTLSSKTGRKLVGRQAKKQLGIVRDAAREGARNSANNAKRKANSAVNTGRRTANSAKRKAQSAYNSARNSDAYKKASGAARTAKRKAKSAYNSAKNSETYKKASSTAKKYASGVKREAGEAYRSTRSDVNRIARKAGSTAKKYGSGVKREAKAAYDSTRSDINRIANNASKKAKSAYSSASGTAKKKVSSAKRTASGVKKKAKKKVSTISNRAHGSRAARRLNNRNW